MDLFELRCSRATISVMARERKSGVRSRLFYYRRAADCRGCVRINAVAEQIAAAARTPLQASVAGLDADGTTLRKAALIAA
jgi:hypothetical protein